MRKIIHIDMDAFFASVEQRDNPDLREKPVAVGGGERRGVVAAASYEARTFGVRSAMSGYRARQLCPQLIFVKPRFDVYKEVSGQLREIFYEYTDLVEPLSFDEAYLDVTENKKDIVLATDVAKAIKRDIVERLHLTASAGVSMNKFLAKIASDYDKPNGLTVITPRRALDFIARLPIEKFYGIGRVTAKKMHEQSIFTGKDLQQWSELDLIRIFGKMGHIYFQIAHNTYDAPVQPHRVRKSIGAEETFVQDTADRDVLLVALRKIAERVALRMARSEMVGRSLTLKVKFADFKRITRQTTIPPRVKGLTSADDMMPLVQKLLIGIQDERRIRLVGLTISKLEATNDIDATQHENMKSEHELGQQLSLAL